MNKQSRDFLNCKMYSNISKWIGNLITYTMSKHLCTSSIQECNVICTNLEYNWFKNTLWTNSVHLSITLSLLYGKQYDFHIIILSWVILMIISWRPLVVWGIRKMHDHFVLAVMVCDIQFVNYTKKYEHLLGPAKSHALFCERGMGTAVILASKTMFYYSDPYRYFSRFKWSTTNKKRNSGTYWPDSPIHWITHNWTCIHVKSTRRQ